MPADWVTVSLEAVAAVEAAVESEVEVEVAFEAFAPSPRGAVWERTRPFQAWGGCLRGEAWEAGL